MTRALRLRITLEDVEPAVWREIEIAPSASLADLHAAIQAAFLWLDAHLWRFEIGDERFEPAQPEDEADPFPEDSFPDDPLPGPMGRTKNAAAVEAAALQGPAGTWRTCRYLYDFGDEWRHRVEGVSVGEAEAGTLPRFLGGARQAPPEDSGGPLCYPDFLEAIGDPDHPDHAEAQEWIEGPFDPEDLMQEEVEARFAELRAAKRRRRGGGG